MSVNLFEAFLADATAPVAPLEAPFSVANQQVTHKLTFRRGRAKNFRSIGNEFLEVDYQRNPSTLVTSDDNGAGKSTMMVWLPIFVLFNDTYSKREKKAGLVNSVSRKDCVGEIEFFTKGEEWKVRRGIKPDFIEVYKQQDGDWKQLENDAAKADTNKLIQELIGIDQKMLENAIVLGKEKYVPFSEMMTADRRLMVETIWDLGFFTVMNEDVKAAIKRINTELSSTDNDRNMCETRLTGKIQALELVEQNNQALQQHSREALEFAENLEKDMIAESGRLEAQLEDAVQRREQLTQEALVVRKDTVEGAEQEVTDLIESYVLPLHDQEEKNKAAEALAEGDIEAKIQGRDDILQRQADIQEEISLSLKEQAAIVGKLQEATNTQSQGKNFRTRFETERTIALNAVKNFHDMGQCPTCNQLVSDDAKAEVSQKYQPEIDDLDKKLVAVDERITAINTEIDKFNVAMDANQEEIAVLRQGLEDIRVELRTFDAEVEEKRRVLRDIQQRGKDAISAILKERDQRVVDLRADISRRANVAAQALDIGIAEAREDVIRLDNEHNRAEDKLTGHRHYMDDLRVKLAKEPTDTAPLRAEIERIGDEHNALKVKQVDLDNARQDHEHLLFLLRDDQTKARIVALYLPYLNQKVNEYLEALNMFLQIQIDDTFDISMLSPERKGQSIFSLSTGQRARLNLAIMLALRDVANLKASVQCNILVLDEILENMSERGVQECVMMLNHKFQGNNLFVISQREQEFQEYFEHNIRYGLRNGLTTILERN